MILAVPAILVFGAGVTRRIGGALRIPAAVLFGIGSWSAGYAATLLLFGHPSPGKDVVLTLLGAALLVKPGKPGTPFGFWSDPTKIRKVSLVFAVAALVFTAVVVEHTLRFPDGGYDAWMIWNTRARFLVRAADFRTAFSPDLLFWLHQDYPWLVPGAVAQAFLLLHSEALAIPALISWLFGALALAVTTCAVVRLAGLRWGLLAGIALATTPCFATFSSNQQSDVPLGAFLVLAIALVAIDQDLLAGLAAGLGAWTKNEGLMYLGCLAVALAVHQRKRLLPFLLGAAPLLALLALFKLDLKPPNDFVTFSTPQMLLQRALSPQRWGELSLLVLRRIVYFQDFALWVPALLAALWFLRKERPGVPGTALILATLAYGPIYVLQPHPVEWIFRTSVDRLFIQLWPAAVVATTTALARATART